MFCALLGHTGERLQDHWSSGFLIFALRHRLWVLTEAVLTCSNNLCFKQNKKNIRFFHLKMPLKIAAYCITGVSQ